MRRFSRLRKWTVFTALVLLLFVCAAGWALLSRPAVKVALVLSGQPALLPEPAVFMRGFDSNGSNLNVTQECYHAEVRFENVGTCSLVRGPYRGPMGLEILEEGATNWISANQQSFHILYAAVPPGGSQTFALRVPSSAKRWRVRCSYQRWFLPRRLLNYVFRDGFGMAVRDEEIHEAQSGEWTLPPKS